MLLMLAALAQAAAAPAAETWTNEEEVYFANEAKRPAPPWLALRVSGQDMVAVDAFGDPVAAPPRFRAVRNGDTMRVIFADGVTTTLRRGRPVTCWASAKRETLKPDGSEDWTFTPGIHIHDQGARARVGGDGAPAAIIRMRNVVWPSGPNRPSLVLYIHTPDQPDHAVSYAWADPGAARVGINLRWIQASCTVDGREPPTPALSPKEKTQ